MRYLTTAAIVLAALMCQDEVGAQKKKEMAPPKWAKVTLGGEIRDLLELRAKYNMYVLLDHDIPAIPAPAQWHGPLPTKLLSYPVRSMQVGEASWVVTLLDQNSEDLKTLLPRLQAAKEPVTVVMEGAIAAVPPGVESFVTYANATGKLRVAGKGTLGMGAIRVEGQARSGTFEIAKGKVTTLAIENGNSPIYVTGGNDIKLTAIKGKVRVEGKLIVQPHGPLVVDAQKITMESPAPKLGPKKKKKGK